MDTRLFGAILASPLLMVTLGASAPAPAAQQYYPGPGVYCLGPNSCYPIAYSHEVYSDAEHTNLIGSGSDSCVQSGSQIYVTSPWLPSGYQVSTQMYVCADGGPYLPGDW